MLHRLNALYIRAMVESDTAWFSEHLSSDFVCTLADGRRINRTEFLRRIDERPDVREVTYDEIDVRPLGDVALVQGVTHCLCGDSPVSTRFTHVWQSRDGRWQAVAAHLTRVAET
jgi:ketosteroid isomerase-like protein